MHDPDSFAAAACAHFIVAYVWLEKYFSRRGDYRRRETSP